MDDQQTYLLNGLLTRHFQLGRIVRFRQVERGRQARAFEIFTAQEKEYLVQIYAPAFEPERLEFAARAVNTIDAHRFSVMPFIKTREGPFAAEGPQGSRMLVSLAPVGSPLEPPQYTEHDISQVGLRLAWMHRLLAEQLDPPTEMPPFADRVAHLVAEPVLSLLRLPLPLGWAHGDVQVAALLHDGDHQLRAITDWGLLHAGCPLEDLVDAFEQFAINERGGIDTARGDSLMHAYHSLSPLTEIAWTPVVARWCAQRMLDAARGRRPAATHVRNVFAPAPERLAMAISGCLPR